MRLAWDVLVVLATVMAGVLVLLGLVHLGQDTLFSGALGTLLHGCAVHAVGGGSGEVASPRAASAFAPVRALPHAAMCGSLGLLSGCSPP